MLEFKIPVVLDSCADHFRRIAGPLLILIMRQRRRLLVNGRRFDREIVRIIFLFNLGLCVGLDLDQPPPGHTVGPVSFEPDFLTDRIGNIVQREDGAGSESRSHGH